MSNKLLITIIAFLLIIVDCLYAVPTIVVSILAWNVTWMNVLTCLVVALIFVAILFLAFYLLFKVGFFK